MEKDVRRRRWPVVVGGLAVVCVCVVVIGLGARGRDGGEERATPTTSATATPTAVEWHEYKGEARPDIEAMGRALEKLGELLARARVGDGEWRVDVAEQAAIVRVNYGELAGMEVPGSLGAVHELLLLAAMDCNVAMGYVENGIDGEDTAALRLAEGLIERCVTGVVVVWAGLE